MEELRDDKTRGVEAVGDVEMCLAVLAVEEVVDALTRCAGTRG